MLLPLQCYVIIYYFLGFVAELFQPGSLASSLPKELFLQRNLPAVEKQLCEKSIHAYAYTRVRSPNHNAAYWN